MIFVIKFKPLPIFLIPTFFISSTLIPFIKVPVEIIIPSTQPQTLLLAIVEFSPVLIPSPDVKIVISFAVELLGISSAIPEKPLKDRFS